MATNSAIPNRRGFADYIDDRPKDGVFRVDRTTGGLAFTGQYVPVGNPSHVVFLDLK